MNDLILLCGFSRSGTTWLSKILDSMPSALLVSEPDKRINKNILFGNVPHCVDGFDKKYIEKYQESIKEITESVYCDLRSFPYFKKQYCDVPYSLYSSISIVYQFINYILNQYNINASLKVPDVLFRKEMDFDLVWKSVNQSSNLLFLQHAFPDMKSIYMLRNPFSSLASILVNNSMKLDGEDFRRIKERIPSIFFKKHNINLKEVENWKELKKRALLWRIDCESAYMVGKHNKNVYIVIYEDLVKDPFGVTSNIFKWLGWQFHDETQEFLLQSTGQKKAPFISRVFSSGYFGVYRKPGVDFTKWKNVITKKDYDLISPVLNESPLLKFWSDDILSL